MKWLLQNFGSRLRYAVQNPSYAAASLIGEVTRSDERFLSAMTGVAASRIRSFLDEPMNMPEFAECLREAAVFFHEAEIESADLYAKKILLQYAAVRAFAPEVVLETGVASGVSSSYLLLALHKNGRGALHSIGLGDPRFLPPDKAPGWMVPDWLRSKWLLHIGDSRKLLIPLSGELRSIDVFIHDSLHTYDHTLWEFRAAFPYIRRGGLLFCDDALWNSAFTEFGNAARASRARILHGVGFLQKNSEEPGEL